MYCNSRWNQRTVVLESVKNCNIFCNVVFINFKLKGIVKRVIKSYNFLKTHTCSFLFLVSFSYKIRNFFTMLGMLRYITKHLKRTTRFYLINIYDRVVVKEQFNFFANYNACSKAIHHHNSYQDIEGLSKIAVLVTWKTTRAQLGSCTKFTI